ncbi:coilin [Chanos chanos]|uniref:Coilin n=1 Tax=Chanos chanos TaxID=29144 RepID=A0A6J2WPY2_CHACN|nr:coilin [Chanos chanos]
MAAPSLNAVRVRLYFDYPPPALPDCRMCWLLVNLNKCRVIADLASVIREKFNYSRKTMLDLFIEDCYLPPPESIYVVRDNDSIRVKVASLPPVNESEPSKHSGIPDHKGKKRRREEQEQSVAGCLSEGPQQKKEKSQVNGSLETGHKKKKTKKDKKKKKEEKQVVSKPEVVTPKQTVPSKSLPDRTSKPAAVSVPTARRKSSESSSDSSDSSEEETQKKTTPARPTPKQSSTIKKSTVIQKSSSSDSSSDDEVVPPSRKNNPSVTPKPPAVTNSNIPAQKPSQTSSDSDSDSDSSSPSASSVKKKPHPQKSPAVTRTPAVQPPPAPALSASTPIVKKPQAACESSDSDSSSETELVIKKPNLQGSGLNIRPPHVGESTGREWGEKRSPWRGRGRGGNRGGGRGGFGRARGTPWKQDYHYSYEESKRLNFNDSLSNKSLILQNPPAPLPKRDYSALPLLAAPPPVGQKIAFKLLELTESYTPEVSEYKEGLIIGYNNSTNVIEMELLTGTQGPAEPGKFDLVYQNPDGSESVEYAVTRGSQLTEQWDSLLEPRLIVENVA